MKTTFLSFVITFLSVASFAQTSVKNQQAVKSITSVEGNGNEGSVKSSGSLHSSTGVQSEAVSKTKEKANSAADKTNNAVLAEKEAIKTQAATEVQEAKEISSKDIILAADAQSGTAVSIGQKDNKISGNASTKSQAGVSSAGIKSTGNQLKEDLKNTAAANTSIVIKNKNQVKTETNTMVTKANQKMTTATTATVQSGTFVSHAIKPKPVTAKMNTRVKTNTGIIIK